MARVLMYHAFGDRTPEQDPHNLFVTEAALTRQLQALRDGGWTALDLDGYLAGLGSGRWPRRSYLLTIDDGYPSTLDVAAPLLRRFGVPAVLFLPPGRLGGTSGWMPQMPHEPIMPPDRLAELADYDIEVGVHGWDHAEMVGMGQVELHRHVVEARSALADLIGVVPRSFAYPFGSHDAASHGAVRDAGYAVGFAVHDGGGRWAVTRTDVNSTDSERSFGLKLSPLWPTAFALARRMPAVRRTAHRVVGFARR